MTRSRPIPRSVWRSTRPIPGLRWPRTDRYADTERPERAARHQGARAAWAWIARRKPERCAALVPTATSTTTPSVTSVGSNVIWGQPFSGSRYLVGDSVEGNDRSIRVFNAIPFFTLRDPRVPAFFTITVTAGRADTARSQDGQTLPGGSGRRLNPVYGQFTSLSRDRAIDARLIEAEAQLAAGNPALVDDAQRAARSRAVDRQHHDGGDGAAGRSRHAAARARSSLPGEGDVDVHARPSTR